MRGPRVLLSSQCTCLSGATHPICPSAEQVDWAAAPLLPLTDPLSSVAATGHCDLQGQASRKFLPPPPGERRKQEKFCDSESWLSHCRQGSWGGWCSAPTNLYLDPEVQLG